jgi:SAM-dependent methyltransferase
VANIDDPAHYGELWADIYDEEHASRDPEDAVAFLAELGDNVRVLELGIGTGRIALPLAARGIDVLGLDASESMVARLQSKPGGGDIDVTIGDMATAPLGGPFGLVFVAFNTFFGLLTQQRQVDCLANVTQSLEPGGRFVLECFVPDIARFRDGNQTVRVVSLEEHRLRINASQHDPVEQRITSQMMIYHPDHIEMLPVILRYVWPAELDVMARLVGLELDNRFGGWTKEPFTAQSSSHVSVYRRRT